jgi:proline utilization trans-activator
VTSSLEQEATDDLDVYRRKSATNYNLVTSVQSILTDLSDWHMNLPRRLQVDFTKLDEDISREVISIYLHYNQCINMTARPLVFHVVRSRLQNQDSSHNKTDWRSGLSPTTIAVIDTCISAARNSIAICATAAKQNIIGQLLHHTLYVMRWLKVHSNIWLHGR